MIAHASSVGLRRTTVVLVAAALAAGAGCSACRQTPAATESAATGARAAPYQLPPQGTTSLVQSLTARRNASGEVVVSGRLLLPEATRIWVDVYPAAGGENPLGRAELYLDTGGVFEAGPFQVPAAAQYRLDLTSRFDRNWQPRDVLGVVGPDGSKLPKSALTPNNPQAPEAGGHLQYSGLVTVSGS